MTAHVSHNSGNNEWYTPPEIIERARNVLDYFDLDPASNPVAQATVKATRYYSAENSGLDKPWFGRIWLNPPYSAALIKQFAAKMVDEVFQGHVEEAVILTNNASETAWFHDFASVSSMICFPRGRIKFWHPDKPPATPLQGQAIFYVGWFEGLFRQRFEDLGLILENKPTVSLHHAE